MGYWGRQWRSPRFIVVLVLLVAAFVLAAVWLPRATVGSVDPFAACVALVALAMSVLGMDGFQRRKVDVDGMLASLLSSAREEERKSRLQLMGRNINPINIDFDIVEDSKGRPAGSRLSGCLRDVVIYFQELHPRRMVITGEPGSGKTIMTLEIVRGLLADDQTDLVPVLLTATTWRIGAGADKGESAEAWLVRSLVKKSGYGPRTARRVLAESRVLLIIDGLDELDSNSAPGADSRAARAAEELNVGLSGRDDVPLIVTCRSDQYMSLRKTHDWIKNATQVRLSPVHAAQARAFITDLVGDVDRWCPVLDIIDPPAVIPSGAVHTTLPAGSAVANALLDALSTPWRLTMAIYVYEERDRSSPGAVYRRDPADLLNPVLRDEGAIRDHLLKLLIPAMVAAHEDGRWRAAERARPPVRRYTPDRVHQWLAVLASYLHENAEGRTVAGRRLSETDLVLHELWPLARGERARYLAAIIIALMSSPIAIGLYLISRQLIIFFYVGALVLGIVCIFGLIPEWPEPVRFDTNMIRLRRGRLVGIFIAGLGVGLVSGIQDGLTSGLVFGAVYGLIAAAGVGLMAEGPGQVSDPKAPLRGDTVAWMVIALVLGLAAGLGAGVGAGVVVGLNGPFVFSLLSGYLYIMVLVVVGQVRYTITEMKDALGTSAASAADRLSRSTDRPELATLVPVPGLTSLRYLALLMCTRWGKVALPWRLAYFMSWCCEVGLLRIAGNGYQFRHVEVREYLAQHPRPLYGVLLVIARKLGLEARLLGEGTVILVSRCQRLSAR